MRIERVAGLAGMCLLMGCGGSSTSSAVETFPAQFIGLPGAVTYNDTNDTITITGRSYFPRDERFLPAEINGYKNTINTFPLSEYAIRGVAPSGTGIATSYNETSNTLERIGTTTFAPTGTILYHGDYVGLFSVDAANINAGAAYVLGDVEISNDLVDTHDFSLLILNRRDFQGTESHRAMRFDLGIESDGTFSARDEVESFGSGTLFGSQEIRDGETATIGMFIGANGEEVIGTISLKYTEIANNSFYSENGVFIAGEVR